MHAHQNATLLKWRGGRRKIQDRIFILEKYFLWIQSGFASRTRNKTLMK